jgi:two-component system chemotaxis response regulator CheY
MSKIILSVDDSASIRQMVRLTLQGAGYEVLEASDGCEAIERVKSAQVEMVVTDLNMPNMDGLTLIRQLRSMSSLRGMPIVFLTTESEDSKKQAAKNAGATGWITKPFKQEHLLAVVKKVIGS